MAITVYGGWNKDDKVRMDSSSGGVFSAIAEDIINKGGVVYGATLMVENNIPNCKHIRCKNIEELARLRKSKYIESDLTDIYCEVKNDLKNGVEVLFSGTPCQIGGLITFLKKDYENLTTVDCICHGIPSKKLLEKYFNELKLIFHNEVKSFEFRNKFEGWLDYSIKAEYKDGGVSSWVARDTSYMKLFFSDMFIRESCFRCQFKGLNRKSDITIGDFWGVNRFFELSHENLKKGVSVIICNSKKGKKILESLEDSLELFQADESIFETTNIYLKQSAVRPYDKNRFKNSLKNNNLDEILIKIQKGESLRKIIGKIQRKLQKSNSYCRRKDRLPNEKWCYSCTACVSICPKNAIVWVEKKNGFRYPKVDKDKCVNCGLCIKSCPRLSL